MTGFLPAWVRHDQVDPDRLMIAGWLWAQGDDYTALGLACSVVPALAHTDRERVAGVVAEVADLLAKHRDCFDDAERYAWVEHGISRPGSGLSWLEWSEVECASLLAEAQRVAAGLVDESRRERVAS